MKKLFYCLATVLLPLGATSQTIVPQKGFGFYGTPYANAKVIDYTPVKESDILFSRRIWREINAKDTANWALLSPNSNLTDIIINAIKMGELTVYDVPGNSKNNLYFEQSIKPKAALAKLSDSVYVPEYDREGNQIGGKMMAQDFSANTITKYMLMEDWIFIRTSGTFEARIVGLAPIIDFKVTNEALGDYVPFWIYFPELRYILATRKVAVNGNDATQMTYDDWFTSRMFTSVVYKESNPRDLPLNVFYTGDELKEQQQRVDRELQAQMANVLGSFEAPPEVPKRGRIKKNTR